MGFSINGIAKTLPVLVPTPPVELLAGSNAFGFGRALTAAVAIEAKPASAVPSAALVAASKMPPQAKHRVKEVSDVPEVVPSRQIAAASGKDEPANDEIAGDPTSDVEKGGGRKSTTPLSPRAPMPPPIFVPTVTMLPPAPEPASAPAVASPVTAPAGDAIAGTGDTAVPTAPAALAPVNGAPPPTKVVSATLLVPPPVLAADTPPPHEIIGSNAASIAQVGRPDDDGPPARTPPATPLRASENGSAKQPGETPPPADPALASVQPVPASVVAAQPFPPPESGLAATLPPPADVIAAPSPVAVSMAVTADTPPPVRIARIAAAPGLVVPIARLPVSVSPKLPSDPIAAAPSLVIPIAQLPVPGSPILPARPAAAGETIAAPPDTSATPAKPVAPAMPTTGGALAAAAVHVATLTQDAERRGDGEPRREPDRSAPSLDATDLASPPAALAGPAATVAPAPQATASQPIADAVLDTRDPTWMRTLVDKIVEAHDANGGRAITMKLRPDALGAIEVSLRRDAGQLHVVITAADPAARNLLADAHPQLAALATDRGLGLASTTVSGADAGPTDAGAGGQPDQRPAATPFANWGPARVSTDDAGPESQHFVRATRERTA